MKPNEIIDAARAKLAANGLLNQSVAASWNHVCDQIEKRALARRPKAKVFEVHHETQVAKLALLTAIVEGKPVQEAEIAALNSVGL